MWTERDAESWYDESQVNPGIKTEEKDPWKNRSQGMKCNTCIFYVQKGDSKGFGRCRRNAPTMKGYPAVYADSDWCGEHKMDEGKLLCG